MRFLAIFPLCIFLFANTQASYAKSAQLELRADGIYTDDGDFVSSIRSVESRTPFFSWGNDATLHETITKLGHFPKAEFENFFIKSGASVNLEGQGLYASLSPSDSSGYGKYVTMGTPNQDILLANYDEVMNAKKADGRRLFSSSNAAYIALRKLGIDGFQGNEPNYMVLFNIRALQYLSNPSGMELLSYMRKRKEIITIVTILDLKNKGYIQDQIPNAATKEYLPEWDKLLRGENLSELERGEILGFFTSALKNNGDFNPDASAFSLGKIFGNSFSLQDPHLKNVADFFQAEAGRLLQGNVQAEALSSYVDKYDAAMKTGNSFFISNPARNEGDRQAILFLRLSKNLRHDGAPSTTLPSPTVSPCSDQYQKI